MLYTNKTYFKICLFDYLDGKMSNGYSKLANYQLGGSGFQIKSKNHQCRRKMNRQSGRKKAHSTNQQFTKNPTCLDGESNSDSKLNIGTTNVSELLLTKPKSFLKNLFSVAKLERYGQIDSSSNSNDQNGYGEEGTSRISVLNENVTTSSTKGNQSILGNVILFKFT